MKNVVVLGTGSQLPQRSLSNTDLEKMVDTSDQWIRTRTGISARRIAGAQEQNYQLAAAAAHQALQEAKLVPEVLDLIIVATVSSHMLMPSTACFVQAELGASKAFAYDLNAACSGFIYGLDLANNYICHRPEMKILLIGSETLSAKLNWQDRNTCVLFGDGAGAVVLGETADETRGILGSKLYSDGRGWHLLCMDAPVSRNPDLRIGQEAKPYIRMNGADIFKQAVRLMEDSILALLTEHSLRMEDIDLIIPHQANIRILSNLRERLSMPEEKIFINLDKYGNTSAASIPIALDEANKQGRMHRGDLILMCTFGGGLTWGSLLLRW